MASSSDAMHFAKDVMQGLETAPSVDAVTATIKAVTLQGGNEAATTMELEGSDAEANPLLKMLEEKGGPDHIACGSCGKYNSHRRMIRSGLICSETTVDGEVFKKFLKVCCRCWQQERKLATGEYDLEDACKDVLEFNSRKQTERSDCYKRAKEAAAKSQTSCRQQRKLLKEYCNSFIQAIVATDLFGALASAAVKYEKILEHRKSLEASLMAIDANLMAEAKELAKLHDWSLIYSVDHIVQLRMADDRYIDQVKLVDEKIRQHDLLYENEAQGTAFGGDRGTQKVMEYEDRIGVTKQGEPVMMLFFMCPACGIYMSSKLWKVFGENLTSGQRWYCGISWPAFQRQHPQLFADLLSRYGSQQRLDEVVGHHFCGRKYRPWARGPAAILEWRGADEAWFCLRADVPPEPLMAEIQKVQQAFTTAWQEMSCQELYDSIPQMQPKTNILPLHQVPGIGKYDLQAHAKAGSPVMDQEKWCQLCIAVAQRNPVLFHDLFLVAQNYKAPV
eukprot:s2420_g2.t1